MADATAPDETPQPPGAGFVHLHTHTEHSILDGTSRLDDLCRAAA